MNERRNPFGGKNPHGMYVPLTDDELEVLERLALAGEFKIVVKDWGHVTGFALGRYNPHTYNGQPLVIFGDKRISFYFRMDFTAPAVPQPCWYFDMEVWALGVRLFPGRQQDEREPYPGRLPTETNGQPIQIAAGIFLDFALDVALDRIDPAVVKAVKPKAIGLTTRHGNMHLNATQRRLLTELRAGERTVREVSVREALTATERQKKGTGR
jgi:hypothetical protein